MVVIVKVVYLTECRLPWVLLLWIILVIVIEMKKPNHYGWDPRLDPLRKRTREQNFFISFPVFRLMDEVWPAASSKATPTSIFLDRLCLLPPVPNNPSPLKLLSSGPLIAAAGSGTKTLVLGNQTALMTKLTMWLLELVFEKNTEDLDFFLKKKVPKWHQNGKMSHSLRACKTGMLNETWVIGAQFVGFQRGMMTQSGTELGWFVRYFCYECVLIPPMSSELE